MDLVKALAGGTPRTLSKAIELIIKEYEDGISLKGYFETAQQYAGSIIMGNVFFGDHDKPMILDEREGLSYYVAISLISIKKVRSKRSRLGYLWNLSNDIACYGGRKQSVISKERINQLLDFVDELGYMQWIHSEQRKLTIARVPYLHQDFNSIYSGANIILCSARHKDRGSTLEEIFLHELGHAYHYNLQRDFELPESFIPFINRWFYKLEAQEIPEERKNVILQDIFADCFTVAVCAQDEQLAKLNSFCPVFQQELIDLLIFYFNEASKESIEIIADGNSFWNKHRAAYFDKVMSSKA